MIFPATGTKWTYRTFVFSVLLLAALMFGAGFGVGISRCHKQKCQVCSSQQGSPDSSSKSDGENTETTPDETTDAHNPASTSAKGCLTGYYGDDDSSSSGSDEGISSVQTDVPPVTEPSNVPPFWLNEIMTVSCENNPDAVRELQTAVELYAQSYIDEFVTYIRNGGNSSLYPHFTVAALAEPWEDTANDTSASASANSTRATSATTSSSSSGASRTRLRNHGQFRHLDTTNEGETTRLPSTATQRNHGPMAQSFAQRRAASSRRATTNSHLAHNGNNTGAVAAAHAADLVQTNGRFVYMVHNGDELVVVQAATSAIRRRVRIPKQNSLSRIAGLLLISTSGEGQEPTEGSASSSDNDVLVVLVQEWGQQQDSSNTLESSTMSNTTLLIYTIDRNDARIQVVKRHGVPGEYQEAYAIGLNVHVVTTDHLDLHRLTEFLTPAVLQGDIAVSDLPMYTVGPQSPELVLNESEYRQLAYEQLQLQRDDFVQELAARLDCTGFVALSNWSGRTDTNPHVFAHVTSLDVMESLSLFDPAATTAPGSGSLYGHMSLLPPDGNFGYMLVSDTMLVLTCGLSSGAQLTNASMPLTWLLALQLSNASVVPLSSSGLVEGIPDFDSTVHHFQANERSYLRILTSRFDTVSDYYHRQYDENPVAPIPVYVSVLDVTDIDGDVSSTDTIPVAGESLVFQLVNGSSIFSTLQYGDFLFVVVVHSYAVAVAASAPSCTLYTIDTVSDPTSPRLVGVQPLKLPVQAMNLYAMDDTWMLGMSYSIASQEWREKPFELLLFNISANDNDDLGDGNGGAPARPFPRLVQMWRAADESIAMRTDDNNSSTSSTTEVSQLDVIVHVTDMNELDDGTSTSAPQYLADSNILVLPVLSIRYRTQPCQSFYNDDDIDAWRQMDDVVSSSNRTGAATRFNSTCSYDQSIEFDGFWLFKIHADGMVVTSSNQTNSTTNYITKHLAIDHAYPDWVKPGCYPIGSGFDGRPSSLTFNGDVMTIKNSVVLSHDVLTKVEAAPPLVMLECNPDAL